MANHYHPDHKAAIMVLLERNGGDFAATAQQTAVPERTLRRWHGQISPHLRQYPPLRTNSAEEMSIPTFDNDIDTLKFVRHQIMDEVTRVAASLNNDTTITTPYQRTLVLTQLLDKIMKLDTHLKPYEETIIRVFRADLKPGPDGKVIENVIRVPVGEK